MKLIRFELRKIYEQKRWLLLVLIVLVSMSGFLWQNISEKSAKQERALEIIEPYVGENQRIQNPLLTMEESLNESQEIQLEYSHEMARILVQWRKAIDQEDWQTIPLIEREFLEILEPFEAAGGQFQALEGIARDIAMEKNQWLIDHELAYEDEVFPLSPMLFLKQHTDVFLSIIGVALLVLFFAHTLTMEKEQHTLATLRTQPLTMRELFASKYISLIILLILYLLVISLALILSFIFGERSLVIEYPQIMRTGETFTIISSLHYVLRTVLFFSSASFFVLSCALLFSKWLHHTLTMFMSLACVMFFGYLLTEMNEPLQSPFNPFQYLRITQIVNEVPEATDWFYPILAVLFSTIILIISAYGKEREWGFSLDRLNKPFKRGETQATKQSLWNIHIFEWRKMWRRKLFTYVCMALVFFILVTYYALSEQTAKKEKAYMESLQEVLMESDFAMSSAESSLERLADDIKEAEDAGEDPSVYLSWFESTETAIQFAEERKQRAENAIAGMKNDEWSHIYEFQLHVNRFANEEFDTGTYGTSIKDFIGTFTVEASIAEKEWLIENNIQPIYSGDYIRTIYYDEGFTDEVQHVKEKWEKHNDKTDNSGLYTLYHFFDEYVYFVPMFLFVVLLGSGFAAERGKKPTLQLLKTQPITLRNMYLGKVTHATSVVAMSSLAIIVFITVVASLVNRFGDWKYPILHYDHQQMMDAANYTGTIIEVEGRGFHFVPLGEIIWQNTLLFMLCFIFVIVVSLFLSIFLKNIFSVLTVTIFVMISGYVLGSHVYTDIAHWLPFTYFNISEVTNGALTIIYDNPGIHFSTGCLILLGSTLVFIGVGYGILSLRTDLK